MAVQADAGASGGAGVRGAKAGGGTSRAPCGDRRRATGSRAAAAVEAGAAAPSRVHQRIRADGDGGGLQCVEAVAAVRSGGVGEEGGGADRTTDREHAVV